MRRVFSFGNLIELLIQRYLQRKSQSEGPQMVVFTKDLIGISLMVTNGYEKEELSVLIEYLQNNKSYSNKNIALDIGANIGNHTVFFSKYFSHVKAFEPNNKVFNVLKCNIDNNCNNVEALNIGLADSDGYLDFYQNDTNLGGSKFTANLNLDPTFRSQVKALDSMDFPQPIGLIKIDVEGFELEVLKGSVMYLNRDSPMILFELLEENFINSESEVIAFLKRIGYNKFGYIRKSPRIDLFPKALNRVMNYIIYRSVRLEFTEEIPVMNHTFVIAEKS